MKFLKEDIYPVLYMAFEPIEDAISKASALLPGV